MSHPSTILVIEDEAAMQRFLRVLLEDEGFQVAIAENGQAGVAAAATRQPLAILLDLGLPDIGGLEVTRRIREWSPVPILVISARGREDDKVRALDNGADDYITKPFGSRELMARLRAALRRVERRDAGTDARVRFGAVVVDRSARVVTRGNDEVHLTPTEYELLTTLIAHPGRVLTHQQILDRVWGDSAGASPHYVRVYMAQLRQKLEEDPARPAHLVTETGVGYRLVGSTTVED